MIMRRVIFFGLFVFMFCSFVVASSEISIDFAVDSSPRELVDYVPSEKSFVDIYSGYFIAALIFVVLVYFVFVRDKKKVKKVAKKKAKKVAKKKIKKVGRKKVVRKRKK